MVYDLPLWFANFLYQQGSTVFATEKLTKVNADIRERKSWLY